MPFIPHTEADVREMLAAIGAPDVESLFAEIPSELRTIVAFNIRLGAIAECAIAE